MKSLARVKTKYWFGTVERSQIFNMTDALFSGAPEPRRGWVEMYANSRGQAIINGLFPNAHIAWVNDCGLPDDWATLEINLPDTVDNVPDHRLDYTSVLKEAGFETLHDCNTDGLAGVLVMAVHRNGGRAARCIDGGIDIYAPPQGIN